MLFYTTPCFIVTVAVFFRFPCSGLLVAVKHVSSTTLMRENNPHDRDQRKHVFFVRWITTEITVVNMPFTALLAHHLHTVTTGHCFLLPRNSVDSCTMISTCLLAKRMINDISDLYQVFLIIYFFVSCGKFESMNGIRMSKMNCNYSNNINRVQHVLNGNSVIICFKRTF